MLSTVRRSLRQPSLLRSFASTLSASNVAPTPADNSPPSSSASRLQANTIVNPVYITLTPPLAPRKDDAKPGELVATLDPTVFNHPIRRDILHLCVVQHRDSLRQGTASTKTRGEVRGSGIKLRRQKGTGKARIGDGQSPILRGGGVAFGPKPRDFSTKLPRKVIEMGMRVGLSAKIKERSLMVMPRISWPNTKTRHLARRIDFLNLRKTLFVAADRDFSDVQRDSNSICYAIRNIPLVQLVHARDLTVYELLKWKRVVLSVNAVEFFETSLGKNIPVANIPLASLEQESEAVTPLEEGMA